MGVRGFARSEHGLQMHGIRRVADEYWNLPAAALYEDIVRRREGLIAAQGPLVVHTGQYTGRSPNDKFVVDEPVSRDKIWWGTVNRPVSEEQFDSIYRRLLAYLQGREVFIQDCHAGADPMHSIPIRVITEYAWHSLFARSLFIPETDPDKLAHHQPAFTLIDLPRFHAVPEMDGTRSEAFILVNFGKRMVLIGGTSYAGEMKKSVFTILNYLLPQRGVLSMHCSANMGQEGDVALFFGLSGTGKTSLSADPDRPLIGDDEHGWSDDGVFNFEGGCYAKVIRLSEEAEPQIYQAVHRFGSILENVSIEPSTRTLDLEDASFTENTRAAYPLRYLGQIVPEARGSHPRNIVFLTADAFGVLPPIARLTPEQAMYHFLSGYTARLAGTERGVTEPQPNFSACFGAPFLPLHPRVYAQLLGERIQRHGSKVWLVNTGWTGGAFGTGSRMPIQATRRMLKAALDGDLEEVSTRTDPIFGLQVPEACPEVPARLLNPRDTWPNPEAYDEQAHKLAGLFKKNFEQFVSEVPEAVLNAGPA